MATLIYRFITLLPFKNFPVKIFHKYILTFYTSASLFLSHGKLCLKYLKPDVFSGFRISIIPLARVGSAPVQIINLFFIGKIIKFLIFRHVAQFKVRIYSVKCHFKSTSYIATSVNISIQTFSREPRLESRRA